MTLAPVPGMLVVSVRWTASSAVRVSSDSAADKLVPVIHGFFSMAATNGIVNKVSASLDPA